MKLKILPGGQLDLNGKHLGRVLDIYDMAHFQLVHGGYITTDLFFRIHAVPCAKDGATPAAAWHTYKRVVDFAQSVGIDLVMENHRDDSNGRVAKTHLRLADPAAAMARCNELFDQIEENRKAAGYARRYKLGGRKAAA